MGDGMLSLAWNNHGSTFCHMLSVLRGLERYTDATVACEGKFYGVHKIVLASCSDYFFNMFEKTPCKHPVVVLKDIYAKEIEALLSYMYDGIVSVAQSDLARLISAAEVLQIKGLAVPDEPPPSTKRASNSRSSSDNKSSPPPKRARREETAATAVVKQRNRSTSPTESLVVLSNDEETGPNYNSPIEERFDRQGEMDVRETPTADNESKEQSAAKEQRPSSPEIETIEDDNIVKEETETPEDDNFDYIGVNQGIEDAASGVHLETSVGAFDINSVKYNSMSADQSCESQAGPSGLQAWSTSMEGEMSNQDYPSDSTSSVVDVSQRTQRTVSVAIITAR